VTQHADSSRRQLLLFAGEDARDKRTEGGLSLTQKLTNRTTASFRMIGWTGERPGLNLGAGLSQRVGRAVVNLEHTTAQYGKDSFTSSAIGAYMPLRRNTLTMRLQSDLATTASLGPAESHSQLAFLTSFIAPLSSKTTLWASASVYRQDDDPQTAFISLGGSRTLSDRWTVQGELFQGLNDTTRRFRLGLGYSPNRDWQLRLLFGPSMQPSADGSINHTFGLQVVRNLSFKQVKSVSVQGQVSLEGKPYSGKLRILLDGEIAAMTDKNGKFHIKHVEAGNHKVAISLNGLDTEVAVEQPSVDVFLKTGKSTQVAFQLKRVAVVRGVVEVEPDEFGKTDPTAGIGIMISAGEGLSAITNGEAEFVLGNLPRGKVKVILISATLPRDFQVIGPSEVEVDLDSGQPLAPVKFKISPKKRQIDFGEPTP